MHRSTYRARLNPAVCIGLKVIVSALIWKCCLPLLIITTLALATSAFVIVYPVFAASPHSDQWEGVILAFVFGSAGTIAWICLAAMNVFWIRGRRLQGRLPWIGTLIAVPCVTPFILANVFSLDATTYANWMMVVSGVAFASYLVWWHTRAPSAVRHADGNHR